jgi:transitional endoplasmic reticulum ATPase
VPNLETREKIFGVHTRNKPVGKKVNMNKMALKTENLTGSDIEFICRKAAMLAIRELIDKKRRKSTEITGDMVITENHFEEAIQLVLKQHTINN